MRTLACLAFVLLTASSTRAAETNAAAAPVDYELHVKDRPVVQRGFLPGSSPRSIAVGLPGGLSYCFDAASCRLRYAWSGGFLDMKPTWHQRGASPPTLRGAKFFVAPDTMPLRLGGRATAPKVRFLGYTLVNQLPEFRFTVDDVEVRERIEAAPGGGLRCVFDLSGTAGAVLFHTAKGVGVSAAGHILEPDAAGWAKIPRGPPMRFEVSIPGPARAGPVKTAATATNER